MSKDQDKGAFKNVPNCDTDVDSDWIKSISSQAMLTQIKIDIMQCDFGGYCKVCISYKGVQMPSLLDSGSEVTLFQQSFFNKHLLGKVDTPSGKKADAHLFLHLAIGNDGQLPVKMYAELDVSFLGLKVPQVGFLIVDELNKSWTRNIKFSRHKWLEFNLT